MADRARNSPPPWDPAIPVWDWPSVASERDAMVEFYEERAAILEYCAGLDRGAAEREAYRLTLEWLR